MNDKERRKELLAQYKEKSPEAGIYRITNKETGKYFLGSSSDLPGVYNRFEFGRKVGSYGTLPLKMSADLKKFGFEGFVIEVLETLEVKPGMTAGEIKNELKLLEKMWREEHPADDLY